MKVIVSPGRVAGSIAPPPSKSYGQRALAAALITPGETRIKSLGQSADEQAALQVIQALGAKVQQTAGGLFVFSNGIQPQTGTIHCGESGLCARLFLPIAALSENPVTVTGRGTLLQRPMQHILEILPELGIAVLENKMTLPVTVKGALQPKDIRIEGHLSSQFLSGLLFAFAAAVKRPVTITAQNLNSYGYARMTLEVLQYFGHAVSEEEAACFAVHPASIPKLRTYEVPADCSSAAPLMLAAALSGSLTLTQMKLPSLQPDAAFVAVLRETGVFIAEANERLEVAQAAQLKAFTFDATHAPDLFPVLAILAARCAGTSRIKGLHRLVHKESNRAESISAMLRAFGVAHEEVDDFLIVQGPCKLQAATIAAFQDHRIVMAASVGALVAEGPVTITGAEAVRKSYPAFFEDLKQLGTTLKIID